MRYFIRAMDQEGYVEASSLDEAFIKFVEETPLPKLGAMLIGHTEWFATGDVNIPDGAIGIRTTIPLVNAGIWTEEQAMDFNQRLVGKRIV